MIKIPFHKLHGAENDFLLTWAEQAPNEGLPPIARKICARYTGIGADGWMLVRKQPDGLHTRLFNSDGSEPEISGNGTRCAAAFALFTGAVEGESIAIETAAGVKMLTSGLFHMPHFASLAIVLGIVAGAVIAGAIAKRREARAATRA